MGFERDAAIEMAREEHEDWCRYYTRRSGGTERRATTPGKSTTNWSTGMTSRANPELFERALSSLATTLIKLRELGYRSRPMTNGTGGNVSSIGTVIAEQTSEPWTWTTSSGETVGAAAGDWFVRETRRETWSVRDDIFRSRYEHIDGDTWRRHGVVTARPARGGEVVDTLEGQVTAAEGDWVVRGEQGEQWPVPADEFARRYERIELPHDR